MRKDAVLVLAQEMRPALDDVQMVRPKAQDLGARVLSRPEQARKYE
jgi:hypothetical protein